MKGLSACFLCWYWLTPTCNTSLCFLISVDNCIKTLPCLWVEPAAVSGWKSPDSLLASDNWTRIRAVFKLQLRLLLLFMWRDKTCPLKDISLLKKFYIIRIQKITFNTININARVDKNESLVGDIYSFCWDKKCWSNLYTVRFKTDIPAWQWQHNIINISPAPTYQVCGVSTPLAGARSLPSLCQGGQRAGTFKTYPYLLNVPAGESFVTFSILYTCIFTFLFYTCLSPCS